jgi:hypothetical protein
LQQQQQKILKKKIFCHFAGLSFWEARRPFRHEGPSKRLSGLLDFRKMKTKV